VNGFTFKGDASLKNALLNLQDALASKQFSDLLNRMRQRRLRRRRENRTSVTHDRASGRIVKGLLVVKIRMPGSRARGRPHAHIEYDGNCHEASYAVDSGERLAGGLTSKYDKPVREWIGQNRKKLD